ncbi:MAG: hypothetical protein IKH63_08895 [Prevotella sp.]|nr:hypothetical protein [Prevotella sp.]
MDNQYNFVVRVNCMTYNHAPYIVDTMNGFTMQQTTFPFVCIIIDDASTDGEQEVISHYLEENFDLNDNAIVKTKETENYRRTFARHKSNPNCYFVVILLKYNHYSIGKPSGYIKDWTECKYYALCEGDDYWIDPFKLQKQVDFLENNPSYNMVYTRYKENHSGTIKEGSWNLLEGNCIKPYLLRKGFIPTASVMFRYTFSFDNDYRKMKFPLGDAPLWIQLMHSGPIKLLPDETTVYRIIKGSASHPKDFKKKLLFLIGALGCRKYFADKYGYTDVSLVLEKEIKTNSLLLDLYNGQYKSFISSKPWKYGIGLKEIYGILINKYNEKNLK